MKEENGITLVALILTIVILIILTTISIQTGTESIDSTKLQGFYTHLEVIQKRVDDVAATNESYIDSFGDTVYIKQQGADLTDAQKTKLQNILTSEGFTNLSIDNFRYFTIQDLENIMDLSEIDYDVFIDFENRAVIAENGVEVDGKTYYVLENTTYFVEHNTTKNTGEIESIDYTVTNYIDNTYKVNVNIKQNLGDIEGLGYVKYKKTTTKYWETSNNTEMILELDVEYNIMYIAPNNTSIEETIKVELDDNNNPIVTKV